MWTLVAFPIFPKRNKNVDIRYFLKMASIPPTPPPQAVPCHSFIRSESLEGEKKPLPALYTHTHTHTHTHGRTPLSTSMCFFFPPPSRILAPHIHGTFPSFVSHETCVCVSVCVLMRSIATISCLLSFSQCAVYAIRLKKAN